MRIRSWHFCVSGAIGGAVGFVLMEMARTAVPPTEGLEEIVALGVHFGAFGLAVGAALGMTEGVVKLQIPRALYGLVLGLVLGALGGFAGGATGQAIFSLLPEPAPPPSTHSDVAIVLDASGSMEDRRILFWGERGNDPSGLRKVAAQQLVKQLGAADRATVVGFSDSARLLMPLTTLSSPEAQRQAAAAIANVGAFGGTNLNAGLSSALGELVSKKKDNHKRHLIFLTDGVGQFDPRVITPAQQHGVTIYTIGLGPEVDRRLLEDAIAQPTGGRYFPVDQADQLWPIFETILVENIRVDMASHDKDAGGDPHLRLALRVLSWLAMGLLIGAGQGVRENTREDLWACSLGGAFGGLVGGALFEPVSGSILVAKGLVGRGVADVVVGACIGGSMRLAQRHLVEMRAPRTTSLLEILPEKSTSLVQSPSDGAIRASGGTASRSIRQQPSGFRGLVMQVKHAVEGEGKTGAQSVAASAPSPSKSADFAPSPPAASASRPVATGPRRPLSFFQSRYPGSRSTAIVMAYKSGHYAVEELSEFFHLTPAQIEQVLRATTN